MADKKISQLIGASTPLTGAETLPVVQSSATVKVSVENLTAGRTVPADKFYAVSASTTPLDVRRTVADSTCLAVFSDSPTLSNCNYMTLGVDPTGGSVGYASGGAFVSTAKNGTGTARPLVLHTFGDNDIVFARQNTQIGSITANGFAPVAGKGIDFSADGQAAGMTSELLDDYEEGTWTPDLQFGGANTGITYVLNNGFYTKTGNIVSGTCWILLSSKGSATGDATIAGLPFANAAGDGNQSPCPTDSSAITFADQMIATVEKIFTYIKLREVTNGGANSALTDGDFGNSSSLQISFQYRAA